MFNLRSLLRIKSLSLGVIALLAVISAGCKDSTSDTPILLTVTPSQPMIAKGTTQQFAAVGKYADGTTKDLSQQVSWTVADGTSVTISGTGLATAVDLGTSTVSASYMGISGVTLITVGAATPVSLNVTPTDPSIAKGTTQQFVAKVTLTDQSVQDVSDQATWTSSDPVVTIDELGLATGADVGEATITASFMQVNATAKLTVTAAVITAITINPSNPSIAKGTTKPFTATATFSDNTTADVSSMATWSVADIAPATNVATISTEGLATAKNLGSATVTATMNDKSGTATLTVTSATLTMVTLSPSKPSIAKGTTQPFTATATFTDNSTQDVTATATWTATDVAPATGVATIAATGVATGTGVGDSTITANYMGTTGSTTLSVTAAVVNKIDVSPSSASIAKGTSQQYTATATLSDATTQDVTAAAVWKTTDVTGTGVASIDATGLAIGKSVGTATITATYQGFSSDATLNVNAAVIDTITVEPATATIAKGTAQQFTATATFSDASTQDVTDLATWAAVDVTGTGVASIDSKGLATGTAAGTATITATYMGVSGSAALTVTPANITKVTVEPATAKIGKGATQQFTATATFTDASTQDVTALALWKAVDVTGTNVASIDDAGVATGKSVGTATITATYLGMSGSATLTVTNAVPNSITITPSTLNIPVNMIVQLKATLVYSDATTQDVTTTATWESVNTATATVTGLGANGGRARGIAAGTVVIKATVMGITGQVTANVANCYVSINELMTASVVSASNEFVELYNSCTFDVDLNNMKLLYRAAGGTTDNTYFLWTATKNITAKGYLVYAGSAYPAGSPKDGLLLNGFAGTGGGVGLVYTSTYTGGAKNLIVDSVGYGPANNIYVEGTAAAAPAAGSSICRKPNGTDTNNNSVDFTTTTLPTPRAAN